MNTLTRLKIEVTNDQLPIIFNGRMLNYYVGKYYNALSELGFELSEQEDAAIIALIDNAVEHGWLQYIDFFFPFIGDNTHPGAGFVPLIDKYGDYSIDDFDMNREPLRTSVDSFKYDNNNRIISYGNRTIGNDRMGTGFRINSKIFNTNRKNYLFAVNPASVLTTYSSNMRLYGALSSTETLASFPQIKAGYRTQSGNANKLYNIYYNAGSPEPSSLEIIPNDILTLSNKYICRFHLGDAIGNYSRGTFDEYNVGYNNLKGSGSSLGADIPIKYYIGSDFYNSGSPENPSYKIKGSPVELYFWGFVNEVLDVPTMATIANDLRQFEVALGRI